MFANGMTNIRRRGAKKETPEEDTVNGLWRIADFMRTPNLAGLNGWEQGTPGMLLIPRVVAQTMAGLGWSKARIREFLWENSKIPMAQMKRAGGPAWIEIDANPVTRASLALDPWPITMKPDNIVLIVAGGSHPDQQLLVAGLQPARDRPRNPRARVLRCAVEAGRSRPGLRRRGVHDLKRGRAHEPGVLAELNNWLFS